MVNTVLIVEDDEMFSSNLRDFLNRHDWDVHVAESAEEAIEVFASVHPYIILADQNLPGSSGIDLLRRLLAQEPQTKIIMMTGDGGARTAVEAMKAGACDYLTKPVALADLKMILDKLRRAATAEQSPPDNLLAVLQRRQARGLVPGKSLAAIIGESPAIEATKAKVRQVLTAEMAISDADLPAILITGETGTGKELLARAVHFDGVRRDKPFVEINCASLPANLLEAELFGHERGAFTDAKERRIGLVEAADGGTLFLDEIGEVDLSIQAKLLKLLEEKSVRRIGGVREQKVNTRIISATNRDLEKMVNEGRFRSDLYFRLRVVTLDMPPLRSGGDDILRLARFYLQAQARRYGKSDLRLTPEAEELLLAYRWPGNVRELRNMMEQTVLLAANDLITPNQLAICPDLWRGDKRSDDRRNEDRRSEARRHEDKNEETKAAPDAPLPKAGVIKFEDMERELVSKALRKTDWNISRSARMLGLSRDMVRHRMDKYSLARPVD